MMRLLEFLVLLALALAIPFTLFLLLPFSLAWLIGLMGGAL